MNCNAEKDKTSKSRRGQGFNVARADSFNQGKNRTALSGTGCEQERDCRNDVSRGASYFGEPQPGKILDQLISQSEERLADIERLIELLLLEKGKTNQGLDQVKRLKELIDSELKDEEE